MHTFSSGSFFLFKCVVFVIVIAEEPTRRGSIKNGTIEIKINEQEAFIYIKTKSGNVRHFNITCEQFQGNGQPKLYQTSELFTATWLTGLKLKVKSVRDGHTGFVYKWEAKAECSLEIRLPIGPYNWYGGSELFVQPWPIQNTAVSKIDFIPNETTGGILERYFLSSDGTAYYVDPADPLFVSIDANVAINFVSEYKEPYRNTNGRDVVLSITVIIGDDLVKTHLSAVELVLGKPTGIPAERMFRYPTWSTWAIYKKNINQTILMKYASDILNHGFLNSQIEIDDHWESCYGSEVFSSNFSNPKDMVSTLKRQGIDVSMWIHPFCNYGCDTYNIGKEHKYLVTSDGYNRTGVVKWWDGEGGMIDVTKPQARAWWSQRLERLRNDIGVTSLKFDAGEASLLPNNSYLYDVSESLQPGVYTTDYAKFASQFGGQVQVRVGFHMQTLPIFVRALVQNPVWGLNNGLHSVLTSSLHTGVVGYPFVFSDMIGGNGSGGVYPDRELFIRWTQLTAFLPAMQFSIPPWVYDDNVTEIAKRMVNLHINITDMIIEAARQATVDGTPIIRPMWWIAPNDPIAQVVNDQFLVGDEILVAPIIQNGNKKRDIYIPIGRWKDELRGGVHVGPLWLENYEVQLEEISYFTNMDN